MQLICMQKFTNSSFPPGFIVFASGKTCGYSNYIVGTQKLCTETHMHEINLSSFQAGGPTLLTLWQGISRIYISNVILMIVQINVHFILYDMRMKRGNFGKGISAELPDSLSVAVTSV